MTNNRQARGFGLLELLITCVIVAILVGLSYPSYQALLVRSRRRQACMVLLAMAGSAEQFALLRGSYAGLALRDLAVPHSAYYRYKVQQVSASRYRFQALAWGVQAKHDKLCQQLSLNQQGEQYPSACWKHN